MHSTRSKDGEWSNPQLSTRKLFPEVTLLLAILTTPIDT